MSAEARLEGGPAYCLHHRVLVTAARPCPECVLDQEFPAHSLYLELLTPDLQEAASEMYRSQRRVWAHVRANDPDVPLGRKVRESIAKREEVRKRRTDAEIEAIEDKVRAIHEQSQDLSWSCVCEIVGSRLEPPLSGRRVRDLAARARWAK